MSHAVAPCLDLRLPSLRAIREEAPCRFADRIGCLYAGSRDDSHRKSHGLYLTPPVVATFMAGMIPQRETMRLLDPAAGAGVLLCAVIEAMAGLDSPPRKVEIVAYEIDQALAEHLQAVLDYLALWAEKRNIRITAEVRCEDFILAQASALDDSAPGRFDAVIANPPYFKIAKSDPRAVAARTVVHGQPNIYGLFMAVAAALLTSGGELVFITPRSFASGPYFQRFRERFFSQMRPIRTHIFDSRCDAFGRDEILQENIILHALRDDGWNSRPVGHGVTISSSAGAADLADSDEWQTELAEVIDPDELAGVFRLPISPEDDETLRQVDSWRDSLRGLGLEISTGPVVPFRATEHLAGKANGVTVPLLWMNHVRPMEIRWPIQTRKPEWINNKPASRKLLVPTSNYVLLRRFSAKEERRRLIAAPLLAAQLDGELIGLENHLNYIYRPGGSLTEDEAFGLAALYNSALLDGYFRCLNGNTQVGAIELRKMPLPPLAAIQALGRAARHNPGDLDAIDRMVAELVEDATPKKGQRGTHG